MSRALPLLLGLSLGCQPTKATVKDPGTDGTDTPNGDTSSGDTSTSTDPYADAAPPVAVINGASSGETGAAFNLDGSASYDPQGFAITDYAWSCTDGSAADGATATLSFATVGTITCTLTVSSESGLTGTASTDLSLTRPVATWTFMVFMNGDNSLESAGLGDMNEMEQVGSTADVNVVVQFDRSAGNSHADGDWKGARRFLVTEDAEPNSVTSPVLQDLGPTDSGSPTAVINFVTWAAENFPAEHYALVMWDHGWGWTAKADDTPAATKGISEDDGSGNDISIAEGEYGQALDGATAALGQKLDLLGFDACEMSTWEVAYATQPYASVMVSSQASEGEDGWPYDTLLADLVADPGMDASDLGNTIAERFNESKDETQSVVNLDALDDVTSAINTLATAMMAASDPSEQFDTAMDKALDFEGGWGTDHDLGDMLDELSTTSDDAGVAGAATDATSALSDVMIANYTYGRSVARATGLSIYSPYKSRFDKSYLDGPWASATLWDDYLQEVTR